MSLRYVLLSLRAQDIYSLRHSMAHLGFVCNLRYVPVMNGAVSVELVKKAQQNIANT